MTDVIKAYLAHVRIVATSMFADYTNHFTYLFHSFNDPTYSTIKKNTALLSSAKKTRTLDVI